MSIVKSTFLAALLLLTTLAATSPTLDVYQYHHENVLGTSFELNVTAQSEEQADRAEEKALAEIDRLNEILSTYSPVSEVSRWLNTQGTEQKVSAELFEVLALFDSWREKTDGALSASVSTASALWHEAANRQTTPTDVQLANAANFMKQPQWQLNASNRTATHLTNQSLSLNTFVKSYIIERVTNKIMNEPGVRGVVVNIGGDIAVAGELSEKIRIANPTADAENDAPLQTVKVKNKFVTTSGNYRRGFSVNGNWYSHIIDARTAMPSSGIISATVIADDAVVAGALATAFNILSPQESDALAARVGDVQYQIITKDQQVITSEGWNESVVSERAEVELGTQPQTKFEAAVELELARFEGRFRRPFVAVWVENKKKESVRTLAVWYNKPRWLPDLKRWFSKNQEMAQDYSTLSSISSATRSPGKYTLTWNGLNDAGEAVPDGKYTIYIEAAREHGTYQIIKKEIEWNGKPNHFDLDGGVEVTTASIDLRTTN